VFEAAEVGNKVSKEDYEAQVPDLRVDLLNAQYDLRAADFPVILLIGGDDPDGCNRLLQVINEWMDARYIRTHAFGPMTDEERERPSFWRYWRALPAKGELALYFGGWTLSAIADRMLGELGEVGLERRIGHIQRFEQALVDDGALLLKFWLHLPDKQRKKREKRSKGRDDAAWAIFDEDGEALEIAHRVLRKTSRSATPWQVVESSDTRYRNLTVAKTLLATLRHRLEAANGSWRPPLPSAPQRVDADPESTVLSSLDLSASLSDEEYEKRLEKLQHRLGRQSARARREGLSSILVFEGADAAGKGGAIRRITGALDACDYRVIPISAPNEQERAHHYLWRFWREVPRAGRLVIFDRSWFGRVLVERVEGLIPEPVWRRSYAELNDFEDQLVEHGILLLKFWLHIDREEQLKRFRARESTPYKKYKITEEDYRNREHWSDYSAAVNSMVARTSTEVAPWNLIPADDKRWARIRVLEIVSDGFKRLLKR
jgi:polyphosphate:AMP phosphotransferase